MNVKLNEKFKGRSVQQNGPIREDVETSKIFDASFTQTLLLLK